MSFELFIPGLGVIARELENVIMMFFPFISSQNKKNNLSDIEYREIDANGFPFLHWLMPLDN